MKPKGGNKKLLIYAGVAGALIGLFVLLKKRQGASSEEPSGTTFASAPGSIPAVGETTADSASAVKNELALFEQQLSTQLPAAIESGVKAGIANNQTAGQGGSLAETIAALGGFITAVQGNRTGEQTGAGAGATPTSPSTGTTPTQPAVHPGAPPAAPPPPSKPPPAPSYKTITCGNGCLGHRYPDGHAECQHRSAGRCVW